MIVIVDYSFNNIASVENMLKKVGVDVITSNNPRDILQADRIVLPGIGHFDTGMKMLSAAGLLEPLNEFALALKRPVLGICLGAQLLGKGSEEGNCAGLGWIDMECKRLPISIKRPIPHMGWNSINRLCTSPLLRSPTENERFYFVHSYYMECKKQENILSKTSYGINFASIVGEKNILGIQFHPEKSLRHGYNIMENFAFGRFE